MKDGATEGTGLRSRDPRFRPGAVSSFLLAFFLFAAAGLALNLHFTGLSHPIYRVVAVAQATLLALLAWSTRWSSESRARLALVLLGGTLALYVAEAGLRYGPLSPVPRPPAGHVGDWDDRSRREVVEDLREGGVEAYPSVHPVWVLKRREEGEPLPLAGISRVATVYCTESGRWLVYESDRHGFTNPDSLWDVERPGPALLGDSFTQGACVPVEQQYPTLLREAWPDAMNLAFGGDGPLLMLATLREYVRPLEPRVVLWNYYEGNDLENLHGESRDTLLSRYLRAGFSQDLAGRQAEVDSMLASLAGRVAHTRFLGFLSLESVRALLQALSPAAAYDENDVVRLHEVLRAARDEVEGWGGRLVFVYLPSWDRYRDVPPPPGVLHRASVLSMIERAGVSVVDLLPVFDGHPDPTALFARHDRRSHYGAEGYRLVAETVARALGQEAVAAGAGGADRRRMSRDQGGSTASPATASSSSAR